LLNLVSQLTKKIEKKRTFKKEMEEKRTVEAGEIRVRRTDAPERAPAKLIKSVKQINKNQNPNFKIRKIILGILILNLME
jgi:hypothetical protein